MCNALLPTARRANRYNSLTTEHCLHCGEPDDWDHIIKCSFQTKHIWRQSLLSKLRKAHNLDSSNHYLLNFLINGLDCWFKGSWLNADQFPCWYHKLIAEQSANGWRHLFNGHLSTQWRIRQDLFIRRGKIRTRANTGSNWLLRTLATIWTHFFPDLERPQRSHSRPRPEVSKPSLTLIHI